MPHKQNSPRISIKTNTPFVFRYLNANPFVVLGVILGFSHYCVKCAALKPIQCQQMNCPVKKNTKWIIVYYIESITQEGAFDSYAHEHMEKRQLCAKIPYGRDLQCRQRNRLLKQSQLRMDTNPKCLFFQLLL